MSRSIGNVFLPVVSEILPYINAVVIALREMIDTLATAMGYELPDYSNSNIYTDVTGEIEGMEEAADDATAANDKLKQSILGFDELNILSKNRSSGSGKTDTTGSGYGVLDDAINEKTASYMKKFNEELDKMSNKSKDMAENIKAFFWNIADKIAPTTSALGNLWSAIKPFALNVGQGIMYFVNGLLSIGEAALTKWIPDGLNAIATVINLIPEDAAIALGGAISGIVIAVVGFNTIANAINKIDDLRDAFGGFLKAIKANPVLLIASAIGALAGAVIALDKAKFDASNIGQYVKKVNELVDSSSDLNEEIQTMLDNQEERKSDIESEYGAIQILADKYFELADNAELTNEQQILLRTYAEKLIEKMPELSGLIDTQTGAYIGTKDAIQGVIDKSLQLALVQAAQDSLTETAQGLYDAEMNLKTLEETRADAINKLTTAQDALNKAIQDSSRYGESSAKTATRVYEAHQKYDETIQALEDSIASIDTQIDTTMHTQKNLNKQWDYATDYISTYSSTAKTEMPKVVSAVTTAYSNISKAVKDWKLPDLIAAVKVDTSALTEFMNSQRGNVWELPVQQKADGGFVKQYAVGGIPDYGQMFIAREAGPELVGNIGNRTAVVNNDQIVQSVSSGVASAVASVMSQMQSGNGSVIHNILNLDGDVVYEAYNKASRSTNARYNPVTA